MDIVKLGVIGISVLTFAVAPVLNAFNTTEVKTNFAGIDGSTNFDVDYDFLPFGEHIYDAINGFFDTVGDLAENAGHVWEGLTSGLNLTPPSYTDDYYINFTTDFFGVKYYLISGSVWAGNVVVWLPEANSGAGGYKASVIFLNSVVFGAATAVSWLPDSQLQSWKTQFGWI
jgi:hypothetical protein